MSEAPKRKIKETVRDADLLKVQIYADHCHAKFTSFLSFVFAYFIGVLILFYTLYYEHLVSLEVWGFSAIFITIVTTLLIIFILLDYKKDIKNVSDMIETIRQGNELPRLEELGKRKKKRV